MLNFHPDQLASWTAGKWSGLPARPISGFSIDSRRLRPGDCFVALRTESRDGHDYVESAFEAGAAAAIVADARAFSGPVLRVADSLEAFQACAREHRRGFGGRVIAVTGSCGKTSTKEWLRNLLGAEETLATEGNLNNHLGVPLTLLQLDPERHRQAVVEAGINQRGEMALLSSLIAPTDCVVSLISLAHAGGIGGEASIAREKAVLPASVPPGGELVFPHSCLAYQEFRNLSGRALVVYEETDPVPAEDAGGVVQFASKLLRRTESRTERQRDRERYRDIVEEESRDTDLVEVTIPALPPLSFELPLLSRGMRQNAVLAAVIAARLGVDPQTLSERAAGWRPARQRGEILRRGERVFYVDCYNANPASMADAVEHFSRRFASLPRLYVLGSMRELGSFSESAHRELGARLRLEAVDRAVFIGEGADWMRSGALSSGASAGSIRAVNETREAASVVENFRGAILLKGSRGYALEVLVPIINGDDSDPEEVAC